MIGLDATPEDILTGILTETTITLGAESIAARAAVQRERWARISYQRAAASVDRARAWEARGMAWAGAISVSSAGMEADLAWVAAISYLLGGAL